MVGGDVLPIADPAGSGRCAVETDVGSGSIAFGIRAGTARRDPAVAEFAAPPPHAIEHPAPSPAPYLTWLELHDKWRRLMSGLGVVQRSREKTCREPARRLANPEHPGRRATVSSG
jgi:hypothetical protein